MNKWVNLESSNVESVFHDRDVLYVKYKGGACYRYTGVPAAVYDNLMLAESKGSFVNKEIKGAYDYELIKDGE